jgi:hypothetical protein
MFPTRIRRVYATVTTLDLWTSLGAVTLYMCLLVGVWLYFAYVMAPAGTVCLCRFA